MALEKTDLLIAPLSSSLSLNDAGIWVSASSSSVMYPEDGNAFCYELEENSFWFRHRNDCIIFAIRCFPPAGSILDVGGGNGFVAQRMLKEGFAAAVLEPGKIGAVNAKNARCIPEVINASFEDACFPPESLSAVGLFDVLEHIQDDGAFLQMIFRALKQDGLIYVTVPAHRYLWSASDTYAEHFRRYNRKMTMELISDHFALRYFTYFFGVLTLPIFLLRTLPYHLLTGKQKNLLSAASEHGTEGGVSAYFMSVFLKRELQRIRKGQQLHWGASCLWVLQKK